MTLHRNLAQALPATQFHFTSADGLRIACSRWDSRGTSRGVVQIAHGMGEHIGRYLGLIGALTSSGLTVYGNDHRGHGLTAPSAARLGDFGEGGFDLLVEDMVRLSGIAKEEHPDGPFVLMGHSMGSFATQQYVLEHSRAIDGMVLSGSGDLDGLARLASSVVDGPSLLNSHFEPARTPADWLSRDAAAVDAYINDPLCFAQLQPASFTSFLAAGSRLSSPECLGKIRSDLPVYLFSGSDDPVGLQLEGVRAQIGRYREAGLRNISHDFYDGGRHEMLNEINRDEVLTNLLGWISVLLQQQELSAAKATSAG